MTHLFDPLTLRGVTFRNRVGISPMCQYSAVDGVANDWHLVHLGSRAVGGAGLVMVEATAVEPRGRITPYDLGLWCDEQIVPLAQIVQVIESHGAIAGIQLAHAGRKASTDRPWDGGAPLADSEGGWEVIGPSTVPFDARYRLPSELTEKEIDGIVEAFVDATRRAVSAGFKVVELHGAHGYLVHSFLSPLSNRRDDCYGGSFENRIRFALDAVRSMRAAWPEHLPFFVRLSATDWTEGGWSLGESVELSRRLSDAGTDVIDCSSGGNVAGASVPVGAGYQVPLAEEIRRCAGMPTAAVGLITEPMQADEIVRNGRADMVLIGRASLRDPYWPARAARSLGCNEAAGWPDQYHRAQL